jgi:hypothetical protein
VSRAILALLFAFAALPLAQAREPALASIDACLARLEPRSDSGYARIAARCPDLPVALAQSPVAAWLPPDWNHADNELSAAGLVELRQLLTQPPSARRPALRVRTLAAVLASVVQAEDAPRSVWQRFKEWLRGLLAAHDSSAPQESWLSRFLQLDLSERAATLITWSLLIFTVVLALGIVGNELRLAGILRGRVRTERSRARAGGAATGSLAQIAGAPPAEQPRLLLELIARRLAEQDRLPSARALTARELTRRARLPHEAARRDLAQLADVCERIRFSGSAVAPGAVAAARTTGERLLQQLQPGALAQAG